MERLCKCFDGDFWYVLKGTKGKRVGVSSAKLALLAFTTPQQFPEFVWPKIVSSKNGLSERMLLFYQRRSTHVDLEKMADQSENLEQFPVKSLTDVFEKIYMEHNTKPPVKYTLTASAKELFFKYSKPCEESQSSSPSSCERINRIKKAEKHVKSSLKHACTVPPPEKNSSS